MRSLAYSLFVMAALLFVNGILMILYAVGVFR